jgi:hypothetical protein
MFTVVSFSEAPIVSATVPDSNVRSVALSEAPIVSATAPDSNIRSVSFSEAPIVSATVPDSNIRAVSFSEAPIVATSNVTRLRHVVTFGVLPTSPVLVDDVAYVSIDFPQPPVLHRGTATIYAFSRPAKVSYPVSFRVALGAWYNAEFNVQEVGKYRTVYDVVTFNVITSDGVSKAYYHVYFTVIPTKLLYVTSFNVQEAPIVYPVTFNIAEGGESVGFDVVFDIIEEWVAVTLPVEVTPAFPGNIPPNPNKHRVNARVFAGDILVGAGFAALLWTGPGPMQLHVFVYEIPQLGADMRVIIYAGAAKVIDVTVPYSPIWEGSYSG